MSVKEGEETHPTKSQKSRYFSEQFDDEDVMLVFRKHPIVMRKGLLFASLAVLVGPLYTLILTYVDKNNPPSITFFFLSFLLSLALAAVVIFRGGYAGILVFT